MVRSAESIKEYLSVLESIPGIDSDNSKHSTPEVTKRFNNWLKSPAENANNFDDEFHHDFTYDYYHSILPEHRSKLLGNPPPNREQARSDTNQNLKFYYRGHNRTGYALQPRIFWKQEYFEHESDIFHKLMIRCPDNLQSLSPLDKLVLMQHYDSPTRLLDITSNPLVALYFACKDMTHDGTDLDQYDGEVILMPAMPGEVSYYDSDKILMLSCIPRFSYNDIRGLTKSSYNAVSASSYGKKKSFSLLKSSYKYSQPLERFFYEVTLHAPSFKREIDPYDLLTPLFVQPNMSNPRIYKQSGAFIISGLSLNPNDNSKN